MTPVFCVLVFVIIWVVQLPFPLHIYTYKMNDDKFENTKIQDLHKKLNCEVDLHLSIYDRASRNIESPDPAGSTCTIDE